MTAREPRPTAGSTASAAPSAPVPASEGGGRSGRRRWLVWVAAGLLVALLGHYLWWYHPRVRPATPEPSDLAARLLTEGDLPVALWIPYPHQNLGALEASFGEGDERRAFLEALARVAGLPEPALPGFGPFAAPPCREMVALSDESGERVVVAARVYPALAALARLAGTLAGNPWLAGGEVDAVGGGATGSWQVRWDGTLWTAGTVTLDEVLSKPGTRGAGEGAGDAAVVPAVAELRLNRPVSYLAAGRHRLRSTDAGLELATLGADVVTSAPMSLRGPNAPALLAVSGARGPLAGASGAFALFRGAEGGGGLAGLLGGLPRAVVWYHPGDPRFDLPGEEILRVVGETAERDGWTLVATHSSALDAATPMTPEVDRLSAGSALAVAADPRGALAAVDEVLDVLESVPLVDRDELREWRDWHTVLSPLTDYGSLWLVSDPGAGGRGATEDRSGGVRLVLAAAEDP